jgi:hypothetical protein
MGIMKKSPTQIVRQPMKPQPVGTGPGGRPVPIVAVYKIGIKNCWDFQSADGTTQEILSPPTATTGTCRRLKKVWPEKVKDAWVWVYEYE